MANVSANKSLGSSAEVQKLNDEMMRTVLPVTVHIGVEAVIGFFGNILILLVYSRHYDKSNFRIFVLFMAMVDLTSCMTTLPLEMFSQMNWYTYYHGWICSIKTFLNVYTAWASASILLLLAYDRNRKICRPLRQHILPPKAKKLCIGSLILSLSVAAPVLPLWGRQTYDLEVNGMNLTVSVCEKSNEFKDTIYPFAYILSVYMIPMAFMVLVLSVLNIMSGLELFGKNRYLSRMKSIKVTHGSKASLSTISQETEVTSICESPAYDNGVRSLNTRNDQNRFNDSMDRKTRALRKFDTIQRTISCDMIDVGIVTTQKGKENGPNSKPCFTLDIPCSVGACDTGEEVFRSSSSGRLFPGRSKGIYRLNSDDIASDQSNKKMKKSQNGLSKPSSSNSFVSNDSRKMEIMKRKTRIMLVLTSVFAITMSTYCIMTFMVSLTDGILKNLTNSGKVTFFFFWRLYFMNTIINPILYGFMDPRFRTGLAVLSQHLIRPCFPWSMRQTA